MSTAETILKIKTYGNSCLRKKSAPIREVTDRHCRLLSAMARLMYDSGGIGLAAPQVGINEAMLVADIGTGLYKLVNPRIIKCQGKQALEEGCLSVPGICLKVKRALEVEIQALDEEGKPQRITAEGLLACVFQHEIDHLKGKLIVDYATFVDRLKIKRKLQTLRKRTTSEELLSSETKLCKLQL